MQVGPYRFVPPWWAVLITLAGVVILSALGVWQIERAHYKERLLAVHHAADVAGPETMHIDPAAVRAHRAQTNLRYGYRYIAIGHYDAAHQILLADQVRGTQTGFRVWTPLVLDSGVRVLVDRGWVAKDQSPNAAKPDPAAPKGRISVHGYWRRFPQPGLRWGDYRQCDLTSWPRPLDYPSAADVRCQYRAPVADGLLLLDADQPGGFVRDWDEDSIGLRPWAHYLYASQWFLMALAAVIILVVVNGKRIH